MKDIKTRWLITGGCGFIGTRLIDNLLHNGNNEIIILDNLSVGTRDDLNTVCEFKETWFDEISEDIKVQLIVGDIKDIATCLKVAEKVDVIVHLAANTGVGPSVDNPQIDMENNVIGVFNMLEAARHNKVKRFIFASSGAPIGECIPPIHEELAPHPVSPYGASKLAGEGYCSAYYQTFGVETISLRFGNVYGPGSGHKNSVVAKFIKKAIDGETLEIYGDGSQTRDFIYIDDLVSAILRSQLTPDIGGEVFQIATNKETTIEEMLDHLIPILERYGLNDINVTHGEKRVGDVMRNFSDTSKAKRVLDWYIRYDLITGLILTTQNFIEPIEKKIDYQEAKDLIENDLIPLLKKRFEYRFPDAFVKCNTRDQDVYNSANGCMYSWYIKIIRALHILDLSSKYSQTDDERLDGDHSCIKRFIKDFGDTEDWISFLVGNLILML